MIIKNCYLTDMIVFILTLISKSSWCFKCLALIEIKKKSGRCLYSFSIDILSRFCTIYIFTYDSRLYEKFHLFEMWKVKETSDQELVQSV